jgi:hypothetical protein
MNITIMNIDRHRNGISGAPFTAIVFRDTGEGASVKVGIVFDAPCHTAVLDINKLVECDVQFGSNSWRGDVYEPHLRQAIARRQVEEQALSDSEAHHGK